MGSNFLVFNLVIVFALPSYRSAGSLTHATIKDVSFYLYTRLNPDDRQQLKINHTDLLTESNFNNEWPVRIVVHGWEADRDSILNTAVRDAYLQKGDFNVIVVDWSPFAKMLYTISVDQIEPVGKIIGLFTEFLQQHGTSFDNMYVIGHSLGAHIAGAAGHSIAPAKYNTIFALDPARPGFEFVPLERKVDPSDAKYVESIQTDTGLLGFGMIRPAGTAAFYFNVLEPTQPGCEGIACSHLRSIDYFAESINSEVGFYGKSCAKCTNFKIMGGEPSTFKKGIFYMTTNSEAPYARGKRVSIVRK